MKFLKKKKNNNNNNKFSNEQFQELLNGINFDEPIEETKNTQPEYIELV